MLNKVISIVDNALSDDKLFYIVEDVSWSIKADGVNIISHLKKIRGKVTTTVLGIDKEAVIHYGSLNTILGKKLYPSNKKRVVATCFHINDKDHIKSKLLLADEHVGKWHTSCSITKEVMIECGINSEKISVIPLGVDHNIYHPAYYINEKKAFRDKYGIADDTIVIGSFQKDGNGWGEGLEPKLIKGPDVLCDVVERLNKKYKIYVLLSGPARGYVINRLETSGVKYKHFCFDDPNEVAELYRQIDLYMVCSRIEGGPKAILESMASGVPIISTRVGMAQDIINDGKNGMLVDVGDVDGIYKRAGKIIEDSGLRKRIVGDAFITAEKYDIDTIVQKYERELYIPILEGI